ncbi:hypothetical protein BH24CHL4_BH24CHL4_10010 [soil metagenome]
MAVAPLWTVQLEAIAAIAAITLSCILAPTAEPDFNWRACNTRAAKQ